MYKIMMHEQNQHGWSVSLVKYENNELTNGFTLNSFKTPKEQIDYIKDFAVMTGYEVEKSF